MLKNAFLLTILCAVSWLVGCEGRQNLVSPQLIEDVIDTCDTDIDIDIVDGEYMARLKVDKACADGIIGKHDAPVVNDIQNITMAEIVKDTKNGNKRFQGSVVRLTAEVEFVLDTDSITLGTQDDDVSFFVASPGDWLENPGFKKTYEEGKSYEFVVYIRHQESDRIFDDWNIWSFAIE